MVWDSGVGCRLVGHDGDGEKQSVVMGTGIEFGLRLSFQPEIARPSAHLLQGRSSFQERIKNNENSEGGLSRNSWSVRGVLAYLEDAGPFLHCVVFFAFGRLCSAICA